MLHLDTRNSSSFTSLLAFKPRQVLLAHHNTTTTTMTASASKHENGPKTTPELKATLHQIILHFLHRNGFSKTLKRFQSEAQIQTDDWKASSLHLEDIFCKHNVCDAGSNQNCSMKRVLENGEAVGKEKASPAIEETTAKKKKKKVVEDQTEVTDEKIKESSKNLCKKSKDIRVNELETQPKKKKLKQDSATSIDDTINWSNTDSLTKKRKDKKKKSIEKVKLEPSTTNEKELVTEAAQKEKKKKKKSNPDENETVEPDVTKKSSKKRKRSFSDENENGIISNEMTVSEESNRQKTKASKEEINGEETNEKLELDGVKSKKKQRNVTMEPKTVNAFQRVKIDEVEFADEKLQDNSYWAKDGAEIGYGAKAQEVLGQVRGRDFRHEKTKKKRGSYRGGLIDQQSHSIKFNYSDED